VCSSRLYIGTSYSRPSLCVPVGSQPECCSSRYRAAAINASCCSLSALKCQTHNALPLPAPNSAEQHSAPSHAVSLYMVQLVLRFLHVELQQQPTRKSCCLVKFQVQTGGWSLFAVTKGDGAVASLGNRPGCRNCHILVLVLEQCWCRPCTNHCCARRADRLSGAPSGYRRVLKGLLYCPKSIHVAHSENVQSLMGKSVR
jgi:hypothetical protein